MPPGGELRLPKSNIAEIIVAPGPAAKRVPPTPAKAATGHTVSRAGAPPFPYQQVEGSAAMDGLREHALGQPISRAKPVVLNRGDRMEVVRTHTVVYPAATGRPETRLEVVQVRLRTEGLTDLKSGKKLPRCRWRAGCCRIGFRRADSKSAKRPPQVHPPRDACAAA